MAGDDHLMQLLTVFLQLAAEQRALAHHEADVVKTLREMTEIGDRDRVRTTGTETREMIFTLLVGDSMEDVARGLMREGDGGTDGLFRARHHPSVETRCGHLSCRLLKTKREGYTNNQFRERKKRNVECLVHYCKGINVFSEMQKYS